MNYIDLHIHSRCSDGTLNPEQILHLARKRNLAAFSITDHDTVRGYVALTDLVTASDPELITGLELSVEIESDELHMLAYHFDLDNEDLNAALSVFRERRNQRGRLIVEKLRGMGLDATFEAAEVAAGGSVMGRPHIADSLVRQGLVQSYEEAFFKYIGNGRPAYVPKSRLGPKEAIELVHKAGGVAVLAHPAIADMHRHIEPLVELGLDGIEIYHHRHTKQDRSLFRHLVDRFGLVCTGGSDHHGRHDREPEIGSLPVPAEYLDNLKLRSEQVRGYH